jgi:hypothetical protein
MDFFSSEYNDNYLDKVAYKGLLDSFFQLILKPSMLTNLKNCTIDPSYRSDHSMIILSLVFNPFNKGKGLWKFNNSLLHEKDYSKIVREKNH